MKLAIVHDWLTGMRGGERCLEVLCRMYPEAELHVLFRRRGTTSPHIERMRIRTGPLQLLPGITRYYRQLLPLMPRAIERVRLPQDVDVVLSLSHAVAKGVRVPPGAKHVCFCFSPMRYAWHLRAHYFPQPAAAPARGLRRVLYPVAGLRGYALDRIREWDRQTSRRVNQFIAISETVRTRIRSAYGRDSTVIFPPVDTRFYTPAAVEREDDYLCVSALVPYKRIDLAIDACRRLNRRLVIIGTGPEQRRLARRAGPRTTLLGWQSNFEIREHLRRCRALLFPGLEDFGIVPLEAQACGTPVIAYGEGGATETVLATDRGRPGTGLFFHPQTVDALCDGIMQFEAHPEWFSSELARRQAESFTVERFECEIRAVLESHAAEATSTSSVSQRAVA